VEVRGRVFKKVVFTDMAAVEALRERNEELRAARGEYLDAEAELTTAAIGDCLRAVIDGYSPRGGDSL
jgi:nitrogenase molybdenum-iron protein alpha/beta subunit